MLASYCGMTYSLAVIMLETTQSINLFIPMICTIIVSRGVASFFWDKSLYDVAIDFKNIPVLRNTAPFEYRFERAENVMKTREVVTLQWISPVSELQRALNTTHSAFPVMNKGTLLGIIPRRFIKILLENRQFTNMSAMTWANMTTGADQKHQIKQTIFLSGQA